MSFMAAVADRESSIIYEDLKDFEGSIAVTDPDIHEGIMELFDDMVSNMNSSPPLNIDSNTKVCIVGAGVAGLRCGAMLAKYGFQVTIIEARDRVGGRIVQEKLASGHIVDMGPNWIHGGDEGIIDSNPIRDIARKTRMVTHQFGDHGSVFFDENGKILDIGNDLSNTMWEIIKEAFKYSNDNTNEIKPKASLKEYFKKRVGEMFPEDARKRQLLMQMIEFWGAFVASNVETQSLKFLWMEEVIDGGNIFCAETYKKILDYIAEKALERCKVMLSTEVTKVDTSEKRISVYTNKGHAMKFDEVVFTAPLGWLKKNHAKVFFPPLPQRMSQAIKNIGYGNLEKVYITFSRAFWRDYNEKNPPGFVQWLEPRYAKGSNFSRWNQEVVDMSTLPKPHDKPVLLFYLFGDQVTMLSDKLSGAGKESRSKYLIKYFRPYYSLLPYYDEKSKDCMPVEALYTDWTADDLAGNGSYTTLRTGLEEADADIEEMREGLPGRSLWFAGEHTAPFIAYGTVTGAYWSGQRVATRMAEDYDRRHQQRVSKNGSQLL